MSNKNFNNNDHESFIEGIYGCMIWRRPKGRGQAQIMPFDRRGPPKIGGYDL